MSKVIAGFTISLDGFIANDEHEINMLYADLAFGGESSELPQATEAFEQGIRETGAVIMGRTTFDMWEDLD